MTERLELIRAALVLLRHFDSVADAIEFLNGVARDRWTIEGL